MLDIDPADVVQKGRLQPGRMFLVDTAQGRIVGDEEIKAAARGRAAVRASGSHAGLVHLDDLPAARRSSRRSTAPSSSSSACSATRPRSCKILLAPMAAAGAEPIGSMGTDTPIAVLSDRPRLLFDYFQQLFAQVTNPPLDAIREELVTSLSAGRSGPRATCSTRRRRRAARSCCRTRSSTTRTSPSCATSTRTATCPASSRSRSTGCTRWPKAATACGARSTTIRRQVSEAIAGGANIIILSDRYSTEELAPIPSLLITAAVHHHLIREKTRTRVGLVIETGEAREVHHIALLLGYGAAAVNPYLVFETIEDLIAEGQLTGSIDAHRPCKNYIKAAGKGVLKVMSKMGISTVASYTGAQVFEAIGLGQELVDEYFTGTTSRLGGVGLDVIAAEVRGPPRARVPDRPERARPPRAEARRRVPVAARGRVPPLQPARPCSSCSTRRAHEAVRDLQAVHARWSTSRRRSLATLRGLFELPRRRAPAGADRRGRAGLARSSSGSPPAR